jgi:hypothetical protein
MRVRLLLALLMPFALPASAGEGALEISPACASGPGCFAGDTPGYPVQITAPGSYVLTGDLVLPDENTTGIEISNSPVTVDLAGHAIRRANCAGSDCALLAGEGFGIFGGAASSGTTVRNGHVWGMGSIGLSLGTECIVDGVDASRNLYGIQTQAGCVVSHCTAASNGVYGIRVGPGSSIQDSAARANGFAGFFGYSGSVLRGNTAYLNQGNGIEGVAGVTVISNTAYQNGGDGILVDPGSTVAGNVSRSNGNDGIEADNGSILQGNSVSSNTGVGLRLGPNVGYRENVVTANTTNGVVSGVNLGNNYCAGTGVVSASCP